MNDKKQQVIQAGIRLVDEGLIARTWGNVSIRTDRQHFAITASGKEYHNLTENDIINLDINDLSYEGQVKPSGEKKIHQAIYQLKSDGGFVIHTHQSNASAVAAMGKSEIRLPRSYEGIGNILPCAGYGLPGTKTITKNVMSTLISTDSKAILMANHGAVCYGRDCEEAFQVVRSLEEACGEVLKSMDIQPWTGRDDKFRVQWDKAKLPAYLDDFAQMFGPSIDISHYDPEALAAAYGEDLEAVEMVVEKNCRAAQAGRCTGARPIKWIECVLMRKVYQKKYSKLKGK